MTAPTVPEMKALGSFSQEAKIPTAEPLSPVVAAYGALWRLITDNPALKLARAELAVMLGGQGSPGHKAAVAWAVSALPEVSEAELAAMDIRPLAARRQAAASAVEQVGIGPLADEPKTPSDPPPVREAPFMYAYECVDDGRWQAYRHQLTRADGSICPGKPLYERPDLLPVSREAVARIIDPRIWRRFDREPPYADHIPREQQIAWWEPLKRSLAKADAILALTGETSRE